MQTSNSQKQILYSKEGKVHASNYCEIYIPSEYFDSGSFAVNTGKNIETIGILFIQSWENDTPSGVKLLKIPTRITLAVYETSQGEITVNGVKIKCTILKYMKDAFIMINAIIQGKSEAEMFLSIMLSGRLPKVISYDDILDIWWKNMELTGVSFKVPSKMYEFIIASLYRDKNNIKKRFGQSYGRSMSVTPYDYKTGNIRDIVENLSTFSGFIYEDISRMITAGINNSYEGIEEQESPLEQIIKM